MSLEARAQKPSLGKVLVIGGCGFVGSHIVDILRQECNASVFILSRNSTKEPERFPDVQYFDADISSLESILPIFEEIQADIVIHTVSPHSMSSSPELLHKVNVEGTKCLLEASMKTGVRAFVYTSSSTVIKRESSMALSNADETWPVITGPAQRDPYLRSKAEAETLVLAANRQTAMLTCALRAAAIFGERDKTAIPGMIERYNAQRTATQIGDNTNIFDWTYVGNHAHAHILAADALLHLHKAKTIPPAEERIDGEAFYTTNYEPRICFWDFPRMVFAALAEEMGEKYEVKPKVMSRRLALFIAFLMTWWCWLVGKKPAMTAEVVHHCCRTAYFNNSKAQQRLGYRMRVSTEEGVKRIAKWFAERGYVKAGVSGTKRDK